MYDQMYDQQMNEIHQRNFCLQPQNICVHIMLVLEK